MTGSKSFILFKMPGESDIQIGEQVTEAQGDAVIRYSSFTGDEHRFAVNLRKVTSPVDDLKLLNPNYSDYFEDTVLGCDHYTTNVKRAIEQISQGEFEKVVLARQAFLERSPDLSMILSRLFQRDDAFVYLLYTPLQGLWIGASPEQFLRVENGTTSAMALAGTRLLDSKTDWTDKEYREQKTVEEYLIDLFHANNLSDVRSDGVKERHADKLVHLCSIVTGKLTSTTELNQLISDMQPTPALGGQPKQKAMSFIQNNEGFNRSLYGGYIGFERDTNLDLYVNIRCARVYANGILQFAGAGINSGSNPELEWLETENKLRVLGDLLRM